MRPTVLHNIEPPNPTIRRRHSASLSEELQLPEGGKDLNNDL